MKIYAISYAASVKKDFKKIERAAVIRIVSAIHTLADNPRPRSAKKLEGLPYYRIRVGDYRVVYHIDDGKVVILVVGVGHRKDVYR